MGRYHELFSYETLGGVARSSVVVIETGIPYTAVFQQMNMGGAYYDQVHKLGGEITYEQIYTFALKKQENDFCSWFDLEKYKTINASNWKDFIEMRSMV